MGSVKELLRGITTIFKAVVCTISNCAITAITCKWWKALKDKVHIFYSSFSKNKKFLLVTTLLYSLNSLHKLDPAAFIPVSFQSQHSFSETQMAAPVKSSWQHLFNSMWAGGWANQGKWATHGWAAAQSRNSNAVNWSNDV